MTRDEVVIRLIDSIQAAKPHIEAMLLRVGQGDRAALERLDVLAGTADAMLYDLDDQLAETKGAGLILAGN